MKYLKWIILMMSLFMIASILYILVFFGLQSQLRIAEQLYLDDNISRFETVVSEIETKISKSHYQLLLGYVHRMKGEWEASTVALDNAELLLSRDDDPILVFEIQANLFINAHHERNIEVMDGSFIKMQQIMPTHPLISLLRGTLYFEKEDYFKALQTFKAVHTVIFPNDWLSHAFRDMFPFGWKFIKESICLVHLKKYEEARSLIERAPTHILEEDFKKVLLGYSYVFEGMDKPLATRATQFQIAYNLFNEIKDKDSVPKRLKLDILDNVVQCLIGYIDYSHTSQIDVFINFMDLWNSADTRDRVSIHLLDKIEQHTILLNWKSFQKDIIFVAKIFTDEFKNTLKILFREKSSDFLQMHRVQEVATFHRAVELLSNPQENYAQEILDLALRSFDGLLAGRSLDMSKVREYMTFFVATITDESGRGQLVMKLLDRSERAWFYEGNNIQSLQLIQSAQHLLMLSQKDYFGHLISSKLKDYYQDAVKKNDIRKITDLFKLMRDFGLEEFISVEHKDLELHIEEAKKDLEADNLGDARLRAELVLQVEPYNIKALQVMSEIAFSLNEFELASHYLQLLPQKSTYFTQLWEIANFFNSNPSENYQALSQRFAKEKPSIDLVYRLCEQSLERGWANYARYWSIFIDKKHQLLKDCIEAYTLFLDRQWEAVQAKVNAIQGFAKNSLGLNAMLVHSSAQAKNSDLASVKQLASLLDKPKQAGAADKYESKILAWIDLNVDPNRVLGLYALSNEKNPSKALKYFENVEKKTDDLSLLMGKLYFQKKRYPEAINSLTEAQKVKGISYKASLPWFLRSLYKKGRYSQLKETMDLIADSYSKERVNKIRDTNAFIIRTCCEMGRYHTVKELYEQFAQNGKISFIEKLFYIQAEYRLKNDFEAVEWSKKWFGDISRMKKQQQIVYMHALLNSGEKMPIGQLVEVNANEPRLSRNNLRNLFDMAVAIGDAKHSQFYAKRLGQPKNSSESISFARYSLFKNDVSGIRKYIQQALNNDPHNLQVRLLSSYYDAKYDNISHINKIKSLYTEINDAHPIDFLDWAWAIFLMQKDDIALVKIEEYFKFLFQIKEKLGSWHCEDFPFCQNFIAFVEVALGNKQAGIRLYRDIISKDPANFLSLSGLGLSYIQDKQYRLAMRVFDRNAAFHQYKTFPWIIKGMLAYQVNDLFDSVKAYQKALTTRPNDIDLGIRYSSLLIETKNWEEAKDTLINILNFDPENAKALDMLLFCYFDSIYRLEVEDLKQLTIEKKKLIKKLEKVNPQRALYYQNLLEKESLSL